MRYDVMRYDAMVIMQEDISHNWDDLRRCVVRKYDMRKYDVIGDDVIRYYVTGDGVRFII